MAQHLQKVFAPRVGGKCTTSRSTPTPNKRFLPVVDPHGRRIAGLYRSKSRYYFQYRPLGKAYSIKQPLSATSIIEAQIEALQIKGGIITKDDPRPLRTALLKRTPQPKSTTIVEATTRWLASKAGSIRPKTIRCYREDLGVWARTLSSFRICRLEEVNTEAATEAADKWLSGLDGKKASRLRVRKRIDTLRRLLRWAKFSGIIDQVPFDGDFGRELVGKTEPKQVRPLIRKEEIQRLIQAARGITQSPSGHERLGPVLADILELITYSGLREGEAFNLTWANIDFQERCLVIHDEKCPQDGAYKRVPFNSGLESVCNRLREQAVTTDIYRTDAFVFHGKHANSPVKNLRKLLNEASEKVGLKAFAKDPRRERLGLVQSVKVGFHDLRRFFITTAVNQGVPTNIVAKWVGHKDGGALIQRTYLKHDEELSKTFAGCLAI